MGKRKQLRVNSGRLSVKGNMSIRHAIESLEPRQLLTTIYVDVNSPGPTHDGSNWTNAFVDLQQAIAASNSGDRINVADGTYKPTTESDRTISFEIKDSVSIYGSYAGYSAVNPDARNFVSTPTVLSGEIGDQGAVTDNSYHVIAATSISLATALDGLTVTAGYAVGPASNFGGGLYSVSSSPTISNCTFKGNAAQFGAGVYNSSSATVVSNCTFDLNSAINSGQGGAVFSTGSPAGTFSSCLFKRNNADQWGGAVYTQSAITMSNCVMVGNTAVFGGAVRNTSSAAYINCTISGNYAMATGGGVYASGNPKFQNSIIWANFALTGPDVNGSVIQTTSDIGANDPTFIRNPSSGPDAVWGTSDDDPGDLRISASSRYVDAGTNSVVLAGTTTDIAGSPRFQDVPSTTDSGSGTAPIIDLGAYETAPALTAAIQSINVAREGVSFVLTGRGASPVAGTIQYAWEWSGDGLFNEANTRTATFPTANFLAGDIVPVTLRITDGIGNTAFASTTIKIVPTICYVDSNAAGANNGTSWTNAYPSLASALTNSAAGQSIRVAQGIYKPTTFTVRNTGFYLKSNVNMFGGYAGLAGANPDARDTVAYPTTLSGDIGAIGDSSDNCFNVVMAANVSSTTTLDGFTITAGCTNVPMTGGGESRISGAGAYVWNSSLTISNCRFQDNQAESTGGAIEVQGTLSPVITHCQFVSNTAGFQGGAIFNGTNSTPMISYCTFTSNSTTSTVGSGGAIANFGAPILTNCLFTGNSSASGGAIYDAYFSTHTISSCSFYRNSAQSGGAVLANFTRLNFQSCEFYGNHAAQIGGAVYQNNQSIDEYYNCAFVGNTAGSGGALALNSFSSIILNASSLTANQATSAGGAISAVANSIITSISGSILWNNSALTGSGLYGDATVSFLSGLTYSDLADGPIGVGTIYADPMFVRSPSAGLDGNWGTVDDDFGDLRLRASSPCVDTGNNGAISPAVFDLAGQTRIVDIPGVHGSVATMDMGAYEAQPTVISGTSSGDSYYVRVSGDQLTVQIWNTLNPVGLPNSSYPIASLVYLSFDTQAGNDTLEVDIANGMAVPIAFAAGADADRLLLTGSNASTALTVATNAVTFGTTAITTSGNEKVILDGPANSAMVFASISVTDKLAVNAGKNLVVDTTSLSITGGGQLDITDGAVVVRTTGALPSITTKILAGQNGFDNTNGQANWNGNGIVSSTARTLNVGLAVDLYGIGAIRNGDLDDLNGPGSRYTTWKSRTVGAEDVLIRFTYLGDADMNGTVTIDDYNMIDGAMLGLFAATGWASGNFDYTGSITIDDYNAIDTGYLYQAGGLGV